MSKRYYDNFPAAPTALVSGIAAACQIPSIVAARVGRDGSAYLDIYQNGNFSVTLRTLADIAEFFEVEEEWVEVESGPSPNVVTVIVAASGFDFRAQFADEDRSPLPGEEDSGESVEAHASLAFSRRS